MRSTLLAFAVAILGAQDPKPECRACHAKDAHLRDYRECRLCGRGMGSCCLPYCCDVRQFTCSECGKPNAGDWPEGGKKVDGLQVTLKSGATKVKAGEAATVVVRITNAGDKAWSREHHAYSHGGFDRHVYWTATVGKDTITNKSDVEYSCSAEETHKKETAFLTIAPGDSFVFAVKVKGKPTSAAGEFKLRVDELSLGLASNEIAINVEK